MKIAVASDGNFVAGILVIVKALLCEAGTAR